MFTHDKKAVPAKQSSKWPIVVLDVDETLILGKDKRGFSIDSYNDGLIDTLVSFGIQEVYLLTAFRLKLLKTKEERTEAQQISRLDLIEYLQSRGITVKAVVSNHDIILSTSLSMTEPGEIKSDAWMKETFILGDYYEKFIKPHEKSIKDNPEIDLNHVKEYKDIILKQEADEKFIQSTMNSYTIKCIKSPLADLLFTALKRDRILADGQPVLFIDDRMEYIGAVTALAEKHKIKIDCLQVKNPYQQEYFTFFAAYPLAVKMINAELETMKKQLPAKLPKYLLFGESRYLSIIQEPINNTLLVFSKVLKDMQKNPHKHDCIGACNAMIRELAKRQQELADITLPPTEEEVVRNVLDSFVSAIEKLALVRDLLGVLYHGEHHAKQEKDKVTLAMAPR